MRVSRTSPQTWHLRPTKTSAERSGRSAVRAARRSWTSWRSTNPPSSARCTRSQATSSWSNGTSRSRRRFGSSNGWTGPHPPVDARFTEPAHSCHVHHPTLLPRRPGPWLGPPADNPSSGHPDGYGAHCSRARTGVSRPVPADGRSIRPRGRRRRPVRPRSLRPLLGRRSETPGDDPDQHGRLPGVLDPVEHPLAPHGHVDGAGADQAPERALDGGHPLDRVERDVDLVAGGRAPLVDQAVAR